MLDLESNIEKWDIRSIEAYVFSKIIDRNVVLPYDLEKEFEISKDCAQGIAYDWYLFKKDRAYDKLKTITKKLDMEERENIEKIAYRLDINYAFAEHIFFNIQEEYLNEILKMDKKDRINYVVSKKLNITKSYAEKLLEIIDE